MPSEFSVRERILQQIKATYAAITPPDTSDPGYVPSQADWPFGFSIVELGPLADEDHRKQYAMGIVAGAERERHTFPYIECNLSIALEFRVTVNKGDPKPAIMGERVLTLVRRVIDLNRNWNALAVDTKRTGSEIDMTTYGDKSVMGVQFIEVMYRTSHLDPRDEQPDFA